MAAAEGVHAVHGLVEIGRRVPDGHDNTVVLAVLQEFLVLQCFRCQGDDLDDVGIWFEPGKIGSLDIFFRLGAFVGRADERPFHMSAQYLGAALIVVPGLTDPAEGFLDASLFHSHRRRYEGRNARRRQGLLHGLQGLVIVIHSVGTGTAVDVFIDESRYDEAAIGINEFRAHAGPELLARYDAPDILFIHNDVTVNDFVRQDNESVDDSFHVDFLLIVFIASSIPQTARLWKLWINEVDKLCTHCQNGYFMLCPPVYTFPQCIHILCITCREHLSTFSQELCTLSAPFVRPL